MQKHCDLCGSIFIGDDHICQSCRKKNPGWKPDWKETISEEAIKETVLGKVTVEEVPFPRGKVKIPKMDDRPYIVTIIITTPDTDSENFRFCKHRLDKYTPGEHRRVIVETRFNEKPYNYARDVNIGLRGTTDSDYYVIMNDDIFVEEGWLEKMVECAEEHPKNGVVGALLLYPGNRMVQHAGGSYNPNVESWADYGTMPVIHEYGNTPIKFSKGRIYEKKYVPWCTGALLLVKAEVIEKMGLWDEKLVAHCDDVEFCFRAWLNGYRVIYCPDVVAIHRENVTRSIGTQQVPDFIFRAVRHLMTVLPKEKADDVYRMVQEANEQSSSSS